MELDDPTSSSSSDPENDYGSEWDEDVVHQLVSHEATLAGGPESPLLITDIEDYETPHEVRLPKVLGKELWFPNRARFLSSQAAATKSTQAVRERTPTADGTVITRSNQSVRADKLTSD